MSFFGYGLHGMFEGPEDEALTYTQSNYQSDCLRLRVTVAGAPSGYF